MLTSIDTIKMRLGIITRNPEMNRAIEMAIKVAATDLSVLVTGESGTGKEFFPKIIHQESVRKHGQYIAINCGAIPEGTIDSELFGHEKGSFTDAKEARKGYFEVANGGTIFLDEVAELPLGTQVRLLRVLETGEFIKVGSSKPQKTDVRVVAATNVDIPEAIAKGKFREDLYYRLNTISINIPPLRNRKEDVELLFLKFSNDISDKYRMPTIQLDDEARLMFINYCWNGNVRQLKNVTEQISIVEQNRIITADILKKYLPAPATNLPIVFNNESHNSMSEREMLYGVLFDMKKDIVELKQVVNTLLSNANSQKKPFNLPDKTFDITIDNQYVNENGDKATALNPEIVEANTEISDESFSLEKKEREIIIKALRKYDGKRNLAAKELGISERTLYRKINQYNLEN